MRARVLWTAPWPDGAAPVILVAVRSLLLLTALAVAAAALDVEREEYRLIGWNDACSVAVERYAFPVLGQAIQAEPITTRIGTLTIIASKPAVETRWALEADGANTYDTTAIEHVRRQLRKAGYGRPGFSETIRDAATAESPGSAEVILSTATLEARPDFWPDTRQWRWGQAHYNPLSTCALLIYEKIGERDRFKFILTRIDNASARFDRGRAHTTNGRLLFNAGNLAAALAETAIGARVAPEMGDTRYHYAAMLALTGRLNEAMRELLAALKQDESFSKKAANDADFDSLRNRQDFQERILKRNRTSPAGPGP